MPSTSGCWPSCLRQAAAAECARTRAPWGGGGEGGNAGGVDLVNATMPASQRAAMPCLTLPRTPLRLQDWVGPASRLTQAVLVLAAAMRAAYAARGLSLPPWRTAQAQLSRWRPQNWQDLSVPLVQLPPEPACCSSAALRGAPVDARFGGGQQDQGGLSSGSSSALERVWGWHGAEAAPGTHLQLQLSAQHQDSTATDQQEAAARQLQDAPHRVIRGFALPAAQPGRAPQGCGDAGGLVRAAPAAAPAPAPAAAAGAAGAAEAVEAVGLPAASPGRSALHRGDATATITLAGCAEAAGGKKAAQKVAACSSIEGTTSTISSSTNVVALLQLGTTPPPAPPRQGPGSNGCTTTSSWAAAVAALSDMPLQRGCFRGLDHLLPPMRVVRLGL